MVSPKAQEREELDQEEKGENYLAWEKTDGGFRESGLGRGLRYRRKRKCATRAFALALERTHPDLSRGELYRNVFTKLQAMDRARRKIWAEENPQEFRERLRIQLDRILYGKRGPLIKTCMEFALRQGFQVFQLHRPILWSVAHRNWGDCILDSYAQDHVVWVSEGTIHDDFDSRYLDPDLRGGLFARTDRRILPNLTKYILIPPNEPETGESLQAEDIDRDLRKRPFPLDLDYTGGDFQAEDRQNRLLEWKLLESSQSENPGIPKDPNFVVPEFLKREIPEGEIPEA